MPGWALRHLAAPVFAVACALAGCATDASDAARAATPDAAANEARAAIEAYVVAVNAMDFDSAGGFYSEAPDFLWIEEGAIRYRSARESRESLAGLGAMASSTRLTLSELSVTALSPDVAVATCRFAQDIGMDGGQGFSFSGAMTIVLRREGGRWLFVSGHTSSPRPGARP